MPVSFTNRFLSLNILFDGTMEKYNKCYNAVQESIEKGKKRPKRPYRDYTIDAKTNRLMNTKYNLMVVWPDHANIEYILKSEYEASPFHGSIDSFYKTIIQQKYIGITYSLTKEFLDRQPAFKINKNMKNSIDKPILSKRMNELWCIDHLDLSMYSKKDQYKYVLVVVDVFTRKMMGLIPQTNMSAETSIQALVEIIQRTGMQPRSVLTDNGTAFESLFEQFLKESNIKHRRTISHRPQSNGIVERVNKEIRVILRRLLIAKKTTQWLDLLPEVMDFYNNRYHSTIRTTPNKLADKIDDEGAREDNEIILKNRARKLVEKYKSQEFELGDYCRITMATMYSAVRAIIKSGNKKNLVIWWCPTIYRVVRVIERNREGLEPNKYELINPFTNQYLCIPVKSGTSIKQTYASEMHYVDPSELDMNQTITENQALILNKCQPTKTDLFWNAVPSRWRVDRPRLAELDDEVIV